MGSGRKDRERAAAWLVPMCLRAPLSILARRKQPGEPCLPRDQPRAASTSGRSSASSAVARRCLWYVRTATRLACHAGA